MLPLNKKTVLITRSANQTEDFINQLHDLGADTISLPLIENTPINKDGLRTIFSSKNFDWLIFTSTNAVKFFFECIEPKNVKNKIAVVGEKTKRGVEKYGMKVDFTPTQFTAKQLAKELPIEKNYSILIPRSNLAKNDIVEILKNRSCSVEALTIYINNSIKYSKNELSNIFNQKIDYITFTSGSSVKYFAELGIELNNEKVVCIGPETAKVAKKSNFPISAIANPHTTEGMIESIKSLNKKTPTN